jgi:hypothetical protein
MVSRDRVTGNKQPRNAASRLISAGAGASLFLAAAAAMATGSAAPAKADFDDLLDPILQPLISSFTESITAFDPAAATDVTSLIDSLGLGSFDSLTSSAAEPAATAASAAAETATGSGDIPVTIESNTEPIVSATINGASNNLLVDTGSSGLVVPWEDLGSNYLTALENLYSLGFPTSIGESGYSGGVDYLYLVYNDATVDYGDGALTTTNTPLDVEFLSWPTSFSANSPLNFEQFLSDDDATGILGIGPDTGGPTTSPFESIANDVTLDLNNSGGSLLVNDTPGTGTALSGAPTIASWVSVDGGPLQEVENDLDSGGATGALPASLFTTNEYDSSTDLVDPGTIISVYGNSSGTDLLYTYTVTADDDPYVVPGDTTNMDSGIAPFLNNSITESYLPSGTGTTWFN